MQSSSASPQSLDAPTQWDIGRLHTLVKIRDYNPLFKAIESVNKKVAGAFQLGFFEGEPYLTYVQSGVSYRLLKDYSGVVSLEPGLDPLEEQLMESNTSPESLTLRFHAPDGLHLVGLETNIHGKILPIYSTTRELKEFRDFRNYESAYIYSALVAHSERTAINVPLVGVRHAGIIGPEREMLSSKEFKQALPNELQTLLSKGISLTTEGSANYLDPSSVVQDESVDGYSALMIANEDGAGRTGIVMKEGKPLLANIRGQEFFIEIKGIGIAYYDPAASIIHSRDGGLSVYGRASQHQVKREFSGYTLSQNNISTNDDIGYLHSIPIHGVLLPESLNDLCVYSNNTMQEKQDQQSSQVLRYSTSTRRLAYSDNPAYGGRYSEKEKVMSLARNYYGQQVAGLWVRAEGASEHASPHPQNFVYYPVFHRILHTDFSDIHLEKEHIPGPLLHDLEEYLVFNSPEARQDLVSGLKTDLQSRGLWTDRMNVFSKTQFDFYELKRILYSEYRSPIVLRKVIFSRNHEAELPKTNDASLFDLQLVLKGDTCANENFEQHLHFTLELTKSAMTTRVENLEDMVDSTFNQRDFPNEMNRIKQVITKLKQVITAIDELASQNEDQVRSSKAKIYASQLLKLLRQEAHHLDEVYDILGVKPVNRAAANAFRLSWAGT